MRRRQLLKASGALCASFGATRAWSQAMVDYAAPPRFARPDIASDEGGLWALMDREEKAVRRSPLLLRDEKLTSYVQQVACRLGGDHCPDIRVFLVRTPLFNASMAPNGMMQVWSGLLLRMENEAQLAAILGHEIAHFLQRHSVERLRDIKGRAAAGQVLGFFGLVGLIGQIAIAAGGYGYSRDHEREADSISLALMQRAGYDVAEASKVWTNLIEESTAAGDETGGATLFATHPASTERRDTLAEMARSISGGRSEPDGYRAHIGPFLDEWLRDEVKRGQYAQSIALFSRQIAAGIEPGLVRYYRGEAYRLRGQNGDHELALADYQTAAKASRPQPAVHRGMGLIYRQRGQREEAVRAFGRYLDLAPDSPDADFIRSYVTELSA